MDKNKYIGLTKGVLTIIDIEEKENNKPNKKHIIVKCKCSICGSVVQSRLDRFTIKAPYATHYCSNCRRDYCRKEQEKKLLNNTYGIIKVLSFSRWDNNGSYQWYNCLCTRCGSITEIRSDHIIKKIPPQSCTNCYHKLLGERTKERYQKEYGLNGEKYELAKKLNNAVSKCKHNASTRNLKFLLSDEQAKSLLIKPCYYCGENLSYGLDRIDSKKDYTVDNVVPCCSTCNIMKNTFSKEVFFDKISKIYNRHCKKSSTTIENTSNDVSE